MWIHALQLFAAACVCIGVAGQEKDLEVKCLDANALAITAGGVVADCASHGLTRTSTINPWLFQLTNVLQAVNASHNKIKEVAQFPVLPRVLTMSLQHNSIRRLKPGAFSGLDNLQNLDLSHNVITGDSLEGVLVGKKTEKDNEPLPIRILFLSFNNIANISSGVFQYLTVLRDLHLDNNPLIIDDNFSAALHSIPELKMLNLAGAELETLPKDVFSGLSLTSLLLNGNKFTTVPDLSALGHSLRLLNINQNPIVELDKTSFSGLQSISEIVTSGMPALTRIHSHTFSTLENLVTVSCTYNPKLVSIDERAFWDHSLAKRIALKETTNSTEGCVYVQRGLMMSDVAPAATKLLAYTTYDGRFEGIEVYLNNNALPRIKKTLLPWLRVRKVTLDGNKWVCDCQLHWLAELLKNKNTTIDRITELQCWEPGWLNGNEILFWEPDLKNTWENFPCIEERKIEAQMEEQEKLRVEQEMKKSPIPDPEPIQESHMRLYLLMILTSLIALVIIIVSVIAFNKYKQYRPIYHVDKMSSPMLTELKTMQGSIAEKKRLVS